MILLCLRRQMEISELGVKFQLQIIILQRCLHFKNVLQDFQTSSNIKALLNGLFYQIQMCQFYI